MVVIQYESILGYKNIVMVTKWTPKPLADDRPKYLALADEIEKAIVDRALEPGDKLPPVRDLAWEMKVTPGTVARAYRIGVERGALEATVGRGTFVRQAGRRDDGLMALTTPMRKPDHYDLRGNWAPVVGQDAIITAALKRMTARGPLPMTEYHRHGEDAPQRQAAAEWLSSGGLPATPERIIVTAGALQASLTAMLATARKPNPTVLMEELAFVGLRDAAHTVGLAVEPVAIDDEGVIPDAVEAACARVRPSAILLTCMHQNPTLATMSPERRAAIAEIARRYDIAIIEDDVYGWLSEKRDPTFVDIAPERCWYITSFSKCISAGLRTGFLLCPEGKTADTARVLLRIAHHLPWLMTALMAELVVSGDAERIRARVAEEIAARVEAMRAAFSDHAPHANLRSHPAASFGWLTLPPEWRLAEFTAACAAENIFIAEGDHFAISGPPPTQSVRITLGGATLTSEEIGDCSAIIARILSRGPAASTMAIT